MISAAPHNSRPTGPGPRRPRIGARPTQRELVIASLLARPDRPAKSSKPR